MSWLFGPRANEHDARDRTFTGFFSLVVTTVGCAVALLALPRGIEPSSLPPLVLDPQLSEAALSADRKLAEQAAPFNSAGELRELYLAHGLAELDPNARYDADRQRRLSLFADELKEAERNLLRVQATEQAMRYLLEGRQSPERASVLGGFPQFLQEHGLVSAEGVWRAPKLSVRAAYKARWNLIHGRPYSEGLSRIETQAFEGFKALHGRLLAPQQRAEGARLFYEAGGKRSAEAYGVFLYQGGALDDGTALLEQAYAQRGELRTRNALLSMWNQESSSAP